MQFMLVPLIKCSTENAAFFPHAFCVAFYGSYYHRNLYSYCKRLRGERERRRENKP